MFICCQFNDAVIAFGHIVTYNSMVSQQCIGKIVEGNDGKLIELLFCHGSIVIGRLRDATIRAWGLPTS
jgi:hypothetical protein